MLIMPFIVQNRSRGFTLVELMVTISLASILMMLAAPSFSQWIRNNQIRSTAESLQNGLRLAKQHAMSQNRQVVFSTINGSPALNAASDVGGVNFSIQTIPFVGGEDPTLHPKFMGGGSFASSASGIKVTPIPGNTESICFNSAGRMVANAAPGTNIDACLAGASVSFDIERVTSVAGQDRPLRVTVSLAGQIRMCDPARTLSSTTPDGCPP